MAHLEFLRDHSLPLSLEVYGRIRNAIDAYAKQGAEQERQARDLFFTLENSLKSWKGQLGGLKDPSLMGKKRAAEETLRGAVVANPDLKAQVSATPGTRWPLHARSCPPTTWNG